jgi:serine/threonine-protein kinase
MRDVTTALGLDPENAEARALLVRLLTEPPPDADKLVDEIGRDAALSSFKLAARMHMIVQLSYLLYIPLLLWMGIREWWMFGAAAAVLSAVFFTAAYYYKHPPDNLQLPLPHLAISLVALLAGQLLFGPLILVPGIAVGTGIAYLTSFDRRVGWVVGGMLAVVLIPAALQFAGVIAPNYELVDGKLMVVPMMTELPPGPTIALLLITHAIVIAASMYFAWTLRRAYTVADRALRLQTWQLSQLVPEDLRQK